MRMGVPLFPAFFRRYSFIGHFKVAMPWRLREQTPAWTCKRNLFALVSDEMSVP
jgi:hypothetical protein